MALNRLTQRLTENFKESTRDLTILGKLPASQAYFDLNDERLRDIAQLLEGSGNKTHEGNCLEGMKRLIAMISKGRDMSSFFPQVVKQVAASSIEIRKLVYIYLLRYAETNPDILLLSINTFQRDLADPSPLIRGMALRVLTSIRLGVIQGVVMHGLRKLVTDRNPWVRKTVALGLIKVYEMDQAVSSEILPLLKTLLKTVSPVTLGSTLEALAIIAGEDLALIHPHFRQICRLLIDTDEWGQVVVLEVLIRYARSFLKQPPLSSDLQGGGIAQSRNRNSEDIPNVNKPLELPRAEGRLNNDKELDPDLELLLSCTAPLLQSRNSAVSLAVVRLYHLCAPVNLQQSWPSAPPILSAMLRLCDSEKEEIACVAWDLAQQMAESVPSLFEPHLERFFVWSTDSAHAKRCKIRILTRLLNPDNAAALIGELKEYGRDPDQQVATDAVNAIGYCIAKTPALKEMGCEAIMSFVLTGEDATVGQAIVVTRTLIHSWSSPQECTLMVGKLAQRLPFISHPGARACIYWLGGRFLQFDEAQPSNDSFPGVARWVPDLLRIGTQSFLTESPATKIEILALSALLTIKCPTSTQIRSMRQRTFSLARFDADWDVRDRARFLQGLIRSSLGSEETPTVDTEENVSGGVVLRPEQAFMILGTDPPSKARSERTELDPPPIPFGSIHSLVGKPIGRTWTVPEWTDVPTDPSIRDEESVHSAEGHDVERELAESLSSLVENRLASPASHVHNIPSPSKPSRKAKTTLDDFLNSGEESDDVSSDAADSDFSDSGSESGQAESEFSTDKSDTKGATRGSLR